MRMIYGVFTSAAPVLTLRIHCVPAAGSIHLRGQEAGIGNFRLDLFLRERTRKTMSVLHEPVERIERRGYLLYIDNRNGARGRNLAGWFSPTG